MAQREIGSIGEEKAVDYLTSHGYEVLERNWRAGHKEVDIICTDGERIVIVEVKTRRSGTDYPAELLDGKKRRNLLEAAAVYLERHKLEKELRFDLMVVESGTGAIEHIREAIQVFD